VEQGNSITFTFAAYDGYHIESVLIDDKNDPKAVAAGFYTFNNVEADHTIHVVFAEGVGIGDVETWHAASLQVYPNPTSGTLRVTSDELRVTNVEIFDIVGKACNESRVTRNENEMDISFLPSGIYFLKIQTADGVVTRKVVKQ
ncbi:MAG: T9SS type A sorting domain-containing protein, partial [Bacteroidales bacterium]|nr:T9SS type A sorting domain-containing protein [Bacteroidales bacterium]